jgi:hypothetical protein
MNPSEQAPLAVVSGSDGNIEQPQNDSVQTQASYMDVLKSWCGSTSLLEDPSSSGPEGGLRNRGGSWCSSGRVWWPCVRRGGLVSWKEEGLICLSFEDTIVTNQGPLRPVVLGANDSEIVCG